MRTMPTIDKKANMEKLVETSKNGTNKEKVVLAASLRRHEEIGLTGNQAATIGINLFKHGDKDTQVTTAHNWRYIRADIDKKLELAEAGLKYGYDDVKDYMVSMLKNSGDTIPLKHRAILKELGVKTTADGFVDPYQRT